jgi:hypothetical protein
MRSGLYQDRLAVESVVRDALKAALRLLASDGEQMPMASRPL